MRYLYAIRKRDGKLVRILETKDETGQTWYIVPLHREVMAMTPSDFEMGYEIDHDFWKPRKSDGRDGYKISDGLHD